MGGPGSLGSQTVPEAASTDRWTGGAPPGTNWWGGAPSLGRRVLRLAWMLLDEQEGAMCAVHALNNILQGDLASFSPADLRAGAELARLADVQGHMAGPEALAAPLEGMPRGRGGAPRVDRHEDAGGNFSYHAVGRALGRRWFHWRGVAVLRDDHGQVNAEATVAAAFAPVVAPTGEEPILGVFVHHGDHYTAMIRREGRIFHLDSLPHSSGEGRFVFEVDAPLFAEYAGYYTRGRLASGGREVGGLYSVFYLGYDYLAAGAHLGVG